jgi:chaperonin GroES
MIKPLPGYVLVEPIEEDGVTASGLYKPESAKDKPSKGKVIAKGGPLDYMAYVTTDPNYVPRDIFVGIGEFVYYKKWTNQEVEDKDGKKYLLVEFKDLLAVEENE